jgi:hypothetical protein
MHATRSRCAVQVTKKTAFLAVLVAAPNGSYCLRFGSLQEHTLCIASGTALHDMHYTVHAELAWACMHCALYLRYHIIVCCL